MRVVAEYHIFFLFRRGFYALHSSFGQKTDKCQIRCRREGNDIFIALWGFWAPLLKSISRLYAYGSFFWKGRLKSVDKCRHWIDKWSHYQGFKRKTGTTHTRLLDCSNKPYWSRIIVLRPGALSIRTSTLNSTNLGLTTVAIN